MYKKILSIALPIILANFLSTIYQLTDLFWIWRYSDTWVAAVSLSSFVLFLFMSVWIWFSIAWTILIAQNFWKKDYKNLNLVAGQSLSLFLILSVILSVLWYFLSSQIIGFMDAETLVKTQAISYLKISFLWGIFMFGTMIIQSILRWVGEVKIPMYIIGLWVILNFILDPFFIMWYAFFPEFWVNWAAIATVINQFIAFVLIFILMYRKWKYHIYFDRASLKIQKDFLKKFFFLWLPSSLEMWLRSLWMLVLAYIIASLWTVITAAYWVWNQILSVILFIGIWFSVATTTLSWQYFWAWNIEKLWELRQKSMILSFLSLTFIWIFIFIFAEKLVAIFVPESAEIIKEWINFVKIIALFLWFTGLQLILVWMFRWVGETKIPMILTLISLWIIQVPIAYFWSLQFWAYAIWWSIPITNVSIFIISYVWYKSEKWKKKYIIE